MSESRIASGQHHYTGHSDLQLLLQLGLTLEVEHFEEVITNCFGFRVLSTN